MLALAPLVLLEFEAHLIVEEGAESVVCIREGYALWLRRYEGENSRLPPLPSVSFASLPPPRFLFLALLLLLMVSKLKTAAARRRLN